MSVFRSVRPSSCQNLTRLMLRDYDRILVNYSSSLLVLNDNGISGSSTWHIQKRCLRSRKNIVIMKKEMKKKEFLAESHDSKVIVRTSKHSMKDNVDRKDRKLVTKKLESTRKLKTNDMNHQVKIDRTYNQRKESIPPPIKNINQSNSVVSGKNKQLEAVIREGVIHLNQITSYIQRNSNAQKSIVLKPERSSHNSSSPNRGIPRNREVDNHDDIDDDEDNNPQLDDTVNTQQEKYYNQSRTDARKLSEERRLFTVAQERLEEMVLTKSGTIPSISSLTIHGEPIFLLGVRMKSISARYADLYWTIPSQLLFDTKLSLEEKIKIQNALAKKMETSPELVGVWFKRIYSTLSSYYPPKLRLKQAKPEMIQEVISYYDGDDNHGEFFK